MANSAPSLAHGEKDPRYDDCLKLQNSINAADERIAKNTISAGVASSHLSNIGNSGGGISTAEGIKNAIGFTEDVVARKWGGMARYQTAIERAGVGKDLGFYLYDIGVAISEESYSGVIAATGGTAGGFLLDHVGKNTGGRAGRLARWGATATGFWAGAYVSLAEYTAVNLIDYYGDIDARSIFVDQLQKSQNRIDRDIFGKRLDMFQYQQKNCSEVLGK